MSAAELIEKTNWQPVVRWNYLTDKAQLVTQEEYDHLVEVAKAYHDLCDALAGELQKQSVHLIFSTTTPHESDEYSLSENDYCRIDDRDL